MKLLLICLYGALAIISAICIMSFASDWLSQPNNFLAAAGFVIYVVFVASLVLAVYHIFKTIKKTNK